MRSGSFSAAGLRRTARRLEVCDTADRRSALRPKGARAILIAAPVASTEVVERLRRVAGEVIAPLVDPDFEAVGRYYDVFVQITDEEALALLDAA